MTDDGNNRQQNVEYLLALFWWDVSCLPFSTEDLSILSRHLHHGRPAGTLGEVGGAAQGGSASTATVREDLVLGVFTEKCAVSRPYYDCGFGRPREDSDGTQVLFSQFSPERTDPGVSVFGVLKLQPGSASLCR